MHQDRVTEIEPRARGGESETAVPAVLLYDTLSSAFGAMKLFARMEREFGFQFHCDPWRFDVLALPKARTAATRATANAALIVVAAQCDTDLPASVKECLEKGIAEKVPASAAVVGIFDPKQRWTEVQRRTREFLQDLADRGIMDFFLHEREVHRNGPEAASAGSRASAPCAHSCLVQSLPSARLGKKDRVCIET